MSHPNLSSFVGRPSVFTISEGKVAVISAYDLAERLKKNSRHVMDR